MRSPALTSRTFALGPSTPAPTSVLEIVEDILSVRLPAGVPFVNAHKIACQRWAEDPDAHAYDAAELAERMRAKLIAGGISFIAETVCSHPSKVQLPSSTVA